MLATAFSAAHGVVQLSSTTTKKVIVDRFDRAAVRGFVNPQSMAGQDGLEVLNTDGQLAVIPYGQIKVVSFVRDWGGKSVLGERREFLARPKASGLWIELVFRDGDRLEAVIPSNLLLIEAAGFTVTPPDGAGNAQKLFVPRQALSAVNVRGVVGIGRARPQRRESAQITLFPTD